MVSCEKYGVLIIEECFQLANLIESELAENMRKI